MQEINKKLNSKDLISKDDEKKKTLSSGISL